MKNLDEKLKIQAARLSASVPEVLSSRLAAAIAREPGSRIKRPRKSVPRLRYGFAMAAAFVVVLIVVGYTVDQPGSNPQLALVVDRGAVQPLDAAAGRSLIDMARQAANAENALRQEWTFLKSDLRRMGTVVRQELGVTGVSDDSA